jgi:hypothetical protein
LGVAGSNPDMALIYYLHLKFTFMQVSKHIWKVSKTGLLIRDVHQKKGRKMLTGISEHGNTIHFPASFLDGDATAFELRRIEAKQERQVLKSLKRFARTTPYKFHVKGMLTFNK